MTGPTAGETRAFGISPHSGPGKGDECRICDFELPGSVTEINVTAIIIVDFESSWQISTGQSNIQLPIDAQGELGQRPSRSASPTITNERMLLPWPKVFLDRSRAVECGTRPRRQEQ